MHENIIHTHGEGGGFFNVARTWPITRRRTFTPRLFRTRLGWAHPDRKEIVETLRYQPGYWSAHKYRGRDGNTFIIRFFYTL